MQTNKQKNYHIKHQVGVGGNNRGRTLSTVTAGRGDAEDGMLAKAHLRDSLIPTLNDLPHTDGSGKLLATVTGRIKLGARGEGSCVVHTHSVTGLREGHAISRREGGFRDAGSLRVRCSDKKTKSPKGHR